MYDASDHNGIHSLLMLVAGFTTAAGSSLKSMEKCKSEVSLRVKSASIHFCLLQCTVQACGGCETEALTVMRISQ